MYMVSLGFKPGSAGADKTTEPPSMYGWRKYIDCQSLVSNWFPLLSEATALSSVPQKLSNFKCFCF